MCHGRIVGYGRVTTHGPSWDLVPLRRDSIVGDGTLHGMPSSDHCHRTVCPEVTVPSPFDPFLVRRHPDLPPRPRVGGPSEPPP